MPDDTVITIVEERIAQPDASKGFILDGFPRTVAQAEALDRMLAKHGIALDAVIELRVDEAALLKRIENRIAEMQSRGEALRPDDNPDVLHRRLVAYREQTAPLIAYYRRHGILRSVDGMAPIGDVAGGDRGGADCGAGGAKSRSRFHGEAGRASPQAGDRKKVQGTGGAAPQGRRCRPQTNSQQAKIEGQSPAASEGEAGQAAAVKQVVHEVASRVDESAGSPLIRVQHPVRRLAAMPGRGGRHALSFYVCGLLR